MPGLLMRHRDRRAWAEVAAGVEVGESADGQESKA